MKEMNNWVNYDYDYNTLREGVRRRPGMYFGSDDCWGLHNAIMDIVNYCIENQKNDIDIVTNGADIRIRHEDEKLASNFDTDVVKSACEFFDYNSNLYQFRFDKEIFKNTEPNTDVLFDILRELAFLNKNLKICYNGHCFCYKNGLMDLYQYLKIKAGFYWHDKHNPISFSAEEGDMELDAVFAAVDSMDPCIFSFVNSCKTVDNGSHVDGFIKALKEVVYKYKQDSPEYKKAIRKNDVALVIHIRTRDPHYAGATKREITNPEVYQFVKKTTKENLGRIFADNPDIVLTYINW